ncbi:hypothetical protein G3570_01475 [Balneolaceae bacterium YR4-1]|uniref:Uncharacterized protein n=1 Tax=Halalkalibaculum roseum TaxID=2709311 RepID=A0A6M1ST50_9BACT|nr:hypothetical protein [Halalkalibaculum roseum]
MTTACSDIDSVTSNSKETITQDLQSNNIENIKRPFRFSTIGPAEFLEPGAEGSVQRCNEEGLLTVRYSGEGEAIHLGHHTFISTNCSPFPFPAPSITNITKGITIFTAANGQDKLITSFSGQQEFNENGEGTVTVVNEIIGGEGKFKGATGQTTGGGSGSGGIVSTESSGYIIFDASNRSDL